MTDRSADRDDRLDVADVDRLIEGHAESPMRLLRKSGAILTLWDDPVRLVGELLRLARLGAVSEARDAEG